MPNQSKSTNQTKLNPNPNFSAINNPSDQSSNPLSGSNMNSIGSVSGRSKPRLVKQRKHWKSKTAQQQAGSGFNPFVDDLKLGDFALNFDSWSEGSSGNFRKFVDGVGNLDSSSKVASRNTGTCAVNPFVDHVIQFGSFENTSDFALNSKSKGCSGNLGKFGGGVDNLDSWSNEASGNVGKFDNLGFVFGNDKSDFGSNSNSDSLSKEASGNVGKFDNVGFLFGNDKSYFGSNSNLDSWSKEASGNVGKFDNAGFVFGNYKSDFGSNSKLDSWLKEASRNVGKLGGGEFGKFDNVGFMFGAQKSDAQREDNENAGESGAGGFVSDNVSLDFGANKSSAHQSNLENGGFVFGVYNKNDSASNLSPEQREGDRSVGQCSANEFQKCNNVGTGFGLISKNDSASNSNSNSNSELNYSNANGGQLGPDNENTGKLGADKFDTSGNVGLLVGANKSFFLSNSSLENGDSCEHGGKLSISGDSKLNLNSEDRDCSRNMGNSGVDEWKRMSNETLTFGSDLAKSASSLNSEMSYPSGKFGDKMGKLEEKNKSDVRKFNNVHFVFGANHRDPKTNSNLGKKESIDNNGKSVPLASGGDSGRVGDAGFVSGTNGSDLRSNSNLEKRESNGNVAKSDSFDIGIASHKAQSMKFDNMGFVFGDNRSVLLSNANPEKSEYSRSSGKLNFFCESKMHVDTTEFQKDKVDGVFVFGSGSKGSSTFSGSSELSDGMNKLDKENADNHNSFVKQQNEYTGSDVNVQQKFVFGSFNSLDSTNGKSPVFKLSDEIKSLNIDEYEKANIANKTKYSNTSSCADVNNMFVFGSNKKAFDSSTVSAGINSLNQLKDATLEVSENDSALEKAEGINVTTGIKKIFTFGNSETAGFSFGGCVENIIPGEVRNKNTKFGVGVLGETITFGKENQPINLNNKNAVGAQPNNDTVCEATSVDKVKVEHEFCFTSTGVGLGTSFTDLNMSNVNAFFSFSANLFPSLSKKLEFSPNSKSVRDKKLKKTKGKSRQHTRNQQLSGKDHLSKEGSYSQNRESPGCGSPMDFSPYEDTDYRASPAQTTVFTAKDEDLAATGEQSDINEVENKSREPNNKASVDHCESCSVADCPVEEFACQAETEQVYSRTEQFNIASSAGVASAEAGGGFCSRTEREESECMTQFCVASNSENTGSSSAQDGLSAIRRQYRKKYKLKVGHGATCATPSPSFDFATSSVQFPPFARNSSHLDSMQVPNGVIMNSQSKGNHILKVDEDAKQGVREASVKEVCEHWRIRGNQSYKNGDPSKAEEFYTKGIDSVPHAKTLQWCIQPLVLCYSNRAATRMYFGRMREALADCTMAAVLDPSYLKVKIRTANCHLMLGEIEHAMHCFSECLESGSDVCLDRRITIEAADGLQKAQKVAERTCQSAELLQQKTSDAALSALGIVAEALSISSHSEKLLEMKCEALYVLRKYEEVIQLCEKTLDLAEKNFSTVDTVNNSVKEDDSECKNSVVRLWRWRLMSKSYFHLGKLEVALDLIEKQEQSRSSSDQYEIQESSIPLAVTVRELLRRKKAGNEAFQSGRHIEAVEHYTAAISSSVKSHPFAAILFCNRAAAHQALGQIADSIADCSLAIAFDGNYPKAVSRRATLHEMIRDYGQAANDLQKLVSLLEDQSQEKVQQSDTSNRPRRIAAKELRRARRCLSSMDEKAKNGIPLDLYLILGVKASDAESEIKKAYRKAALRHHPDKAGQFLVRSEGGDDGQLLKEIAEKVHKDADRLFKMIGEAYTVLSDPTKRLNHNLEEEKREARRDSNRSNSSGKSSDFYSSPFDRSRSAGKPSDFYSSPFERSSNRRYWQESSKSYGDSSCRW